MKKEYEIWQRGRLLADHIRKAETFPSRFRGLMSKDGLSEGEGLLLVHCGSIHCFFMRFTIDVIYLDKNMVVIAKETVRPWHIGGIYGSAKHVLELAEGKGQTFRIGEPIEVTEREDKS